MSKPAHTGTPMSRESTNSFQRTGSPPVPTLSSPNSTQDSIHGTLNNKDIDFRAVSKHLVNQEDTLKHHGGDVARHIYQQMDHVYRNDDQRPRRTRSSSFSTYLDEARRRESTASDLNVPGGFRREFLINKSLKENHAPPNFLTSNFMEFLSIYGHFAGEDLYDEDDTNEENYDDVFDEESLLLGDRRNGQLGSQPRKQPKGSASVAKTYFLVFKALVGSGVLFLPRAFSNGGLVFSIFILSLFGFLTFMCYIILIKTKKILNLSSFGELGYKTYGKPLKFCILISIIISQVGFVATYILFTAENMTSFCRNFLSIDSPYLTTANIVIIQCIFLVPLVLIRNLAKLSLISLISSVFIVVGLLIIFYYSGLQLAEQGLGPNIVNFNSKSWSMLIGVAVTAFEGIGLILPIEASMAKPEKFPQVLFISMVLITTLFVCVGTIGYTAFGDKVKSIIILNLPNDKLSVNMIMVLYSCAVFLTAPLQLFPAVKIGESTLFGFLVSADYKGFKDEDGRLYHGSGKYSTNIKWLKNLFRALFVIVICTLAYVNSKNIDKFVSFNGCFACIPLVYIYPPLIHLKTYQYDKQENKVGKFLKVFDVVLVAVGIVVVTYTTYQILIIN